MKRQFECPSCGAAVAFQSAVSIFAVCPFCRSMLLRRDLNIEAIGRMAVVSDDMSPLQLGTQGRYERLDFSLVGRIRRSWSDGFWDEWHALFADGSTGWVASAQGFYTVSFEGQETEKLPDLKQLETGETVCLEDESFQVDDIKETVCVVSEGELPWAALQGVKTTSVDLSGEDRRFACLEYSEKEKRLSLGHYVSFEELNFSHLKTLHGW